MHTTILKTFECRKPETQNILFRGTQISQIAHQRNLTKVPSMSDVELDPSSYRAIGLRLNHLRQALGLTQVEIGQQLGMTGPRWANYETGTSRIPVDEALKLVRIASVSLDWIYYGNPDLLPFHLVKKLEATTPKAPKRRPRDKEADNEIDQSH